MQKTRQLQWSELTACNFLLHENAGTVAGAAAVRQHFN